MYTESIVLTLICIFHIVFVCVCVFNAVNLECPPSHLHGHVLQ